MHPTRPEARFDCMGLLWILNGDSITALSGNRAEIRTQRGARQTYTRRKYPTGAIAVWELSDD